MILTQLIFLGTGGTIPTDRRSLPCAAIIHGREILLFDCGEGAQHQYLKSGLKLNRPLKIFITHLHGDHILGLPGLLQTFSLLGRDETVEVYGPAGVADFLKAVRDTVRFHLSYSVRIREIEEGAVVSRQTYRIESDRANHSVPCLSYAFIEKARPGKFHPEKAIALGVKPGPLFKRLQDGVSVRVGRRVVKPSQVMDKPRRGVKIVFSGDTYYSRKLVALAKGADILVHECTFDDNLAEKASGDKHATPRIAARVAKEAGVSELILNHITQRYPDPGILLKHAISAFPRTKIAEDLDRMHVEAVS